MAAGGEVQTLAGLFPELSVSHSLLLKDTKEKVNAGGKTSICCFPVTFILTNNSNTTGFFNTADSVEHMMSHIDDVKCNCNYSFFFFFF